MIEVVCTWNNFYLSARAEEKSEAEQIAARATLNKVELDIRSEELFGH